MEIIDYLLARKKAGGGSDVTIEQLTATENGTYSEEGKAYSPVVVNVPAPANSYQLKDVPSGTVSTIDDGTALPMPSLKVGIEPAQDLHGYDHPWAGGAGKNKYGGSALKSSLLAVTEAVEGSDSNGNFVNIPRSTALNDVILFDGFEENQQYTIIFKILPSGSASSNIRVYYSDNTYYTITASADETLTTVTYTTTAEKTVSSIKLGYWYLSTCKIYYDDCGVFVGANQTFEPYSNICPISGWTAANVTRTGKNLTDDVINGHYIDTDGTEKDLSSYRCTDYVNVNGITSLKATVSTTYPNFWVWRIASYDVNKNFIEMSLNRTIANGNFKEEVTLPSNAKYIRTSAIIKSTNWNIYNKSTYNTYTIQFRDGDNPLTVYGGTLDVTSGELVVDRTEVDLGSPVWAYTNGRFYYNPTDAKKYTLIEMPNMLCSQYSISQYASQADNSISSYAGYIYIRADSYSGDTAAFKTAMNGVQLCYELAEPITYQLAPTQVRTLVGNNNIWSDTGNIIEGKYFKSLT